MEMINSLLMFKELMQKDCDYVTFLNELNEKFNIYEAKNRSDKAVLTGYFTPHIDALPKKSKGFRVPVIIKDSDESRSNYFVHSGRDVYDLKMEGAGVVQLPDGKNMTIEYAGKKRLGTIKKIVKRVKKRVRVASKNGHKSTKIVYVKKIIKVAKQAPYFRVTEGGPYGWADVPLIPKYTAAIDRDLAPMGGLMYIKSTQNLESVDTVFDTHPSFSQFEGFMLAQDVGSAIKGGGRVDVYCGEGDEARYGANSITRIGMVYLLVAKKDKLDINIDRRADLHE
jgi:membrane-bound lytic murein transglycosylase A